MSNAVMSYEDKRTMAASIAASGLFGITKPEQALTLMALCEAEGLHPATAIRDYHIVNGRPALKADAMMARFISSGGRVEWLSYTDQEVRAKFTHPSGGSVEVDWTPARAKQAGIANQMHAKYPRQMLRARVISEGVRTVCPQVAVGMYTVEEVSEFGPPKGIVVDPRPDDMKPMDAEHREQYASALIPLLDLDQSAMPRPEAAKVCLKVRDLWDELTQDEQIQVFDRFNTKQKTRLRRISALDLSMLKQEAQIIDVTTTEAA